MKAQILALVAVSALLTGCSDSDDATSMNHGQMNMNYQMPTRGEATPAPMGGTFLN
jgi:major membrane immunogen (membrane-anchored lipoprotein)